MTEQPSAELSVGTSGEVAAMRPGAGFNVGRRLRRIIAYTWVGTVYAFIFAPIIVVVGSSFDGGSVIAGRAVLQFPPSNLSLQWYGLIPQSMFQSLWVSTSMAAISAACGIVLGVPAALGIIRGKFYGKTLMGSLFRAPLQIPFIVIGLAFLQSYYFLGDVMGLHLRATFTGLVLGHVFVSTPYVVGAVGAQLQRFNPAYEEAALIHGASRWSAFYRVTMPIIMPGIYAGGLYAFLVSFGDVTISLFLSGPDISPLPVEIFYALDNDFEPTITAIATLVVVGSLIILYLIQRLVGMEVLLRGGGSG